MQITGVRGVRIHVHSLIGASIFLAVLLGCSSAKTDGEPQGKQGGKAADADHVKAAVDSLWYPIYTIENPATTINPYDYNKNISVPHAMAELRDAFDRGVTLFAGEAENRLEQLLGDAYREQLQPIYDFLKDLPDLGGQVIPILPRHVVRRNMLETTFDAGRGCPFQCSFCTIINVQGRNRRASRPSNAFLLK